MPLATVNVFIWTCMFLLTLQQKFGTLLHETEFLKVWKKLHEIKNIKSHENKVTRTCIYMIIFWAKRTIVSTKNFYIIFRCSFFPIHVQKKIFHKNYISKNFVFLDCFEFRNAKNAAIQILYSENKIFLYKNISVNV